VEDRHLSCFYAYNIINVHGFSHPETERVEALIFKGGLDSGSWSSNASGQASYYARCIPHNLLKDRNSFIITYKKSCVF